MNLLENLNFIDFNGNEETTSEKDGKKYMPQ